MESFIIGINVDMLVFMDNQNGKFIYNVIKYFQLLRPVLERLHIISEKLWVGRKTLNKQTNKQTNNPVRGTSCTHRRP